MKRVGVNKDEDWGAVSRGLRGASAKSAETMAESRVDLRDVDEAELRFLSKTLWEGRSDV